MAAERKPSLETIQARGGVDTGARVLQLTSQPTISINMHMEQRFVPAAGRRIAIERQTFGQSPELWVCDQDTTRLYRIDAGKAVTASFACNACTRAHPWLTPDDRHVIFNSNVNAVAQVYAATVPTELLDKLVNLK